MKQVHQIAKTGEMNSDEAWQAASAADATAKASDQKGKPSILTTKADNLRSLAHQAILAGMPVGQMVACKASKQVEGVGGLFKVKDLNDTEALLEPVLIGPLKRDSLAIPTIDLITCWGPKVDKIPVLVSGWYNEHPHPDWLWQGIVSKVFWADPNRTCLRIF